MTTEANAQAIDAPTEPTAQQVVESFLSALERLDMSAALDHVSGDVRWVNHPWVSSKNKVQFEKVLNGMFASAEVFEVRYNDIHERDNGVVYTDRIDIFEGGGVSMTLPVQGEFRVRDGKVTEWVERFSWVTLTLEIAKSLPSIVTARLPGK
jgi:limonene-1,2-epoxide hydrolase